MGEGRRALLIYAIFIIRGYCVVLQDKSVRSRSQEIRAKVAPERVTRANDARGITATE